MLLNFTKMHGLGNDFIVIDAINQSLELSAELAQRLADRHFGIGCDQILIIEAPKNPQTDFFYRIFNADGSEVAQCGNGARCFARYVHDKGLTDKSCIDVETVAGPMQLNIDDTGMVTVDMGLPKFSPADIPLRREQQATLYEFEDGDEIIQLSAVSLGNPHAVIQVDDIQTAAVETLGPWLESHPDFPERANIGFMQIINRQHIALRVFERGSGETQACGSGACAAMIVARQQGLVNDKVAVTLHGGMLQIDWTGNEREAVRMTGPASFVYNGQIEI